FVLASHDLHLSSQDPAVWSPLRGLWFGREILRARHAMAVGAAVAGSLLLTVGCGSSSSSSTASSSTSSAVNAAAATSISAFGGMSGLVAAAKKEGQLNVITLPANWANYGTIMKDFTARYGIKINDANPDGSSQDELNAVNQLKGQSRAPDVLDVGTAFAVKGDQAGVLATYKVQSWSNIPADAKASDGTWFADYGGDVAIGYKSAKVTHPAALVRGPAEADVQERGRHQRQPDPGERRVLRRLRLGAGQRRFARQHHARHRLLQEAAQHGQLRAGHSQRRHHGERSDADRDLVGLPAGIRDRAERSRAQDRDPVGRLLRRLLRPGHQQVRTGPGRGQAVGGVPLLRHRPEPLAPGQGPPDRASVAGDGGHGRPDRVQGAAAGPVRQRHLPHPVTAVGGGVDRRPAVV